MGVIVGSGGSGSEGHSDRFSFATGTSDPGSAAAGDCYFNTSSNKLRVYNGSAWKNYTEEPQYGTQNNPLTDPQQLVTQGSSDGNYWIDPPGQTAKECYFNNTDNGGGWMLAAVVRRSQGLAHYNTGWVNAGSPDTDTPKTNSGSTKKLSDSFVNAVRNMSSYSGGTAWWLQSLGWTSSNGDGNMSFFVKTSATFDATDHAESQNDRTMCTYTYNANSYSDLNPNSGTRGFGHHHNGNSYFAWCRHPESPNPGFRSDSRGESDGYLWVK